MDSLDRSFRHLVLLVDDDADTREMYSEYLLGANYNVAEASDARQAFAKAASLQPSIVVTDFRLPHADGGQLCRRLKSDRRTRQIPLIVLTGWGTSTEEAGNCDALLTKPCLPSDLLSQIDGLLHAAAALRNEAVGLQVESRLLTQHTRQLRARSSKLARTAGKRRQLLAMKNLHGSLSAATGLVKAATPKTRTTQRLRGK